MDKRNLFVGCRDSDVRRTFLDFEYKILFIWFNFVGFNVTQIGTTTENFPMVDAIQLDAIYADSSTTSSGGTVPTSTSSSSKSTTTETSITTGIGDFAFGSMPYD
jgi:hypothetical protein